MLFTVGTGDPASLEPVIILIILVLGAQKLTKMAPLLSTLAVPSHCDEIIVSLPAPHVLLLTLNRPKALNAVSPQMSDSVDRILSWAEQEGEIW